MKIFILISEYTGRPHVDRIAFLSFEDAMKVCPIGFTPIELKLK